MVPRRDPLAGRKRVRLEELADRDWVLYHPDHGLAGIVEEVCRGAGFTPTRHGADVAGGGRGAARGGRARASRSSRTTSSSAASTAPCCDSSRACSATSPSTRAAAVADRDGVRRRRPLGRHGRGPQGVALDPSLRLRPRAPRASIVAVLALLLAGCGSASQQRRDDHAQPTTAAVVRDRRARTIAQRTTTATLDQVTTIVIGGIGDQGARHRPRRVRRGRARTSTSSAPGGQFPGEVIVIGPFTYTNANVQAALKRPDGASRGRSSTRASSPRRRQRTRPTSSRTSVAPAYLAFGVEPRDARAGASADGAVFCGAHRSEARRSARVPAGDAARRSRRRCEATTRPRDFNARFWVDSHDRDPPRASSPGRRRAARRSPSTRPTSRFGAPVEHEAAAGAEHQGHHAEELTARSHARPAASTTSSRGATSWRSPIASAAQPRTLNGRRNAGRGDPHLELVAVDGRHRHAEHRRDVEVDVGPVRRATRRPRARALSTSSGSTACASSSFARTFSPYSSARAGNVARCDSAAS